jgi:multidrug efflux pump subunit AcrA (membrane-fusion protein)
LKNRKHGATAQGVIVLMIVLFAILTAYTLISRRMGGAGASAGAETAAARPARQGASRQAGDGPARQGASGQTGDGPARQGAPRQAGRSQSAGTAVRVLAVSLGTIENTIILNGDVLAERQVSIYPVSAGKITRLPYRLGDVVRGGDIIAIIDPSRPGEIFQSSPVRATIAGTILQLPFGTGEQVASSQVIAVIGDLSKLAVETYIPERFTAAMRPGLAAEVFFDSLPGETFTATIAELSPVIDPASRTLRIRLRFRRADSRVKSGMFATISLVTASRANIQVLPREAVINTYGSWIVFVLENNSTVRRREITLGMENETLVEVISGLTPGEIVVYSGQNFLSDGDNVRVIE